MSSTEPDSYLSTSKILCSVGPVTIAALTALCLGYDAGVMSAAISLMRRDFHLNSTQEGMVMGCINLVAAAGALYAGKAADYRGRVPALGITAAILAVGPLVIACSTGFAMLFAGRIVTGIGVGLAFVVAPLYAAEVAPAELRGGIVTSVEVLVNGGILLGYLSALLLPYSNWRVVTGLAAVPALLCGLITIWLPESPRWLAGAERSQEAEAALQRLGLSGEEAAKELQAIRSALEEEQSVAEASWKEVLCPTPVVRRMLLAGLGCAFFQQISGSEAIVYYTPRILDHLGMHGRAQRNSGAMAVGAAKFVGAVFGACFLDLVGRRGGLLVSCTGVFVCLIGLALADSVSFGLTVLCAFMVFFELGLAPGAFVLGTECYPVSIRAKALGLGMVITRFLSGMVAVVLPPVLKVVSMTACLWAFSFAAAWGIVWALLCVPETKGLTLEETVKLFEREGDDEVLLAKQPPEYGTAPAVAEKS